ncbi:MAG: hypothetical protein LC745_03370 [Planctomycetia bacterium]|nr:hypothetical protein [Planctomycetia bacterium]
MATDRQVQETIAQCLATMARYHEGGRTRCATTLMIAEVQALAAWVLEMDLREGEAVEVILGPVEAELLARYGSELGVRLSADFHKAFEDFGTFDHMTYGPGQAMAPVRPFAVSGPVGEVRR